MRVWKSRRRRRESRRESEELDASETLESSSTGVSWIMSSNRDKDCEPYKSNQTKVKSKAKLRIEGLTFIQCEILRNLAKVSDLLHFPHFSSWEWEAALGDKCQNVNL